MKFAGGNPVVPAGDYGPVAAMMANELTLARSGALDADLLAQQPFYGTNLTKPLLFIEDGAYFVNKATAMGLSGAQWGVMNETGSYPGQPWLWLYTLWYQIPGWTNSANIDMIAIYMTGLATILLLLIPFIPGLRDIPRLIPLHRLIWRNWDTRAAVRRRNQPGHHHQHRPLPAVTQPPAPFPDPFESPAAAPDSMTGRRVKPAEPIAQPRRRRPAAAAAAGAPPRASRPRGRP